MFSCTGAAILRFHNEPKVAWIYPDEMVWTEYQGEYGKAWEGTTHLANVVWLRFERTEDGYPVSLVTGDDYAIVQDFEFDEPPRITHKVLERLTDEEIVQWAFRVRGPDDGPQ